MHECRACHSVLSKPFLSLGKMPLSNAFLTKRQLDHKEPVYPLDVYVCRKCFLVQLDEFEPVKTIFSDHYAYYSSYSDTWLAHCQDYVRTIQERLALDQKSFVLEIASNDGYLLQYFKRRGIPILGVEPTANTAQAARKRGIPTDISFFDSRYARKLARADKRADLIIGNNVLAHTPHLTDFIKGLKTALKPQGVITLEFPHLAKLLKGHQFDTIYHEHYSYFLLSTVVSLFARNGLEIFDVEELPTHGGSLRVYARHKTSHSSEKISGRVAKILREEKVSGLLSMMTYSEFGKKVEWTKKQLLKFFHRVKAEHKRVVGYGAPAKGNTLLNYCGIRTDFLEYTVDRNPFKQGKYLPGTHIPIKHPDQITKDKPDYLLILPWNIKDEIMQQMSVIRKWGGRFVVPLPQATVLS